MPFAWNGATTPKLLVRQWKMKKKHIDIVACEDLVKISMLITYNEEHNLKYNTSEVSSKV